MSIVDGINQDPLQLDTRVDARGKPNVRASLPVPVTLFVISLILPIFINLGTLRMPPYRFVLLIMLVPLLVKWLTGKAGRIMVADICIVLLSLWSGLAFFVNHNLSIAVEPAGVIVIESMGAYLLGRCYVRSPEDFRAISRLWFIVVLVLAPFAIVETITSRSPIIDFVGAFVETYGMNENEPRLGFERVQGPFQHPLLYGVFCGSAVGVTYYVLGYGKTFLARLGPTLAIFFTGFLAVSSGPLSAQLAQTLIIGWDKALAQIKQRWWIFVMLILAAYVTVDLLSSRTPFEVFTSYLALNPTTAYGRIIIFRYGWETVMNHPLFGIGFHAWTEKPWWLGDSVDMFWLSHAMQKGILVGFLYLISLFLVVIATIRRSGLDERTSAYRLGFVTTMMGFFIAGWTTHFWGPTYVFYLFLLGSGAWISQYKPPDESEQSIENDELFKKQKVSVQSLPSPIIGSLENPGQQQRLAKTAPPA
jgi:hypothetical protein